MKQEKVRSLRLLDLAGVLVALLVWQLMSMWLGRSRLPGPIEVALQLVTIFKAIPAMSAQGVGGKNILPHLAYTIVRTLVGVTIGVALGVGLGMLMSRNRALRLLLELPLEGLRAIPPLALIPFMLLWLGVGNWNQIALILIYSFSVTVVYTVNAVGNVNPIFIQSALTLGADERAVFRTVVLPAMLPELLGGIRVTIALSWGYETVAELMGAKMGVGMVFKSVMAFYQTSTIMAGIVVVAAVAMLFDRAFTLTVRSVFLAWVPREELW